MNSNYILIYVGLSTSKDINLYLKLFGKVIESSHHSHHTSYKKHLLNRKV